MATALFDQELAQRIESARIAAGMTRSALAQLSSIPYTTLNRKLDGVGSFAVNELHRISISLEVSWDDLWPIAEAA